MDKLLMQVALDDQVTKPLQGMTRTMQSSMEMGKQGMQNMATGGAGLVASGLAIQNALMPAIEMDRKIGEVRSLGVTDEQLKQLQSTALEFSSTYGKSATEFVDASYDIKSAMGDLSGVELAGITESSAILAAATKADTKTVTDYMGTMYGVFETQANKMGKADWAAQVAGMTAKSVEMFKTDGSKMAQAFSSLGSSATAFGVDMSEQMAVLGSLGASMGGSEAATKYTAFLSGAVKAQEQLGVSFFDSAGKMMPMVDILDTLENQVGHLSDDQQYKVLKEAFGSGEAVKLIQNLQDKTGSLTTQIDELGKIQGIDQASMMAGAMTDQWERLEASWFAVRAAVFGAILPSINAVVGSMTGGITVLTGWTDEFPFLTEAFGYAAIGALALGGVVGGLSLAMGIGQMMSGGWAVTMGVLNGMMKVMRISMIASTAAAWLFNAALWANPLTWVATGVVALITGITAVIFWWDDLTAAFGDTAWFDVIAGSIIGLVDMLNMIPGVDIQLDSPAIDNSTLEAASQAEKSARQPMRALAAGHDGMPAVNGGSLMTYKNSANVPTMPQNVVKNMTSSESKQTHNTRQFGDVHITNQTAMTPDELAQWDELNAG